MGTVKTDSINTTYTYEAYDLGTEYIQPATDVRSGESGVDSSVTFDLLQGDRTCVFVYAIEAITAGQLCEWDFTEYTTDKCKAYYVEPCDADAVTPYLLAGVADQAIAAGSYGWIIKKGVVVVKAEGAVTVPNALDSDGATGGEGCVMNTAGVDGNIGYTLEDLDETKTGFIQAYINIP
tara:strand:+ start:3289 stop:3825 length:537 start_codon:yes stop_codon:yes gene_type:complete